MPANHRTPKERPLSERELQVVALARRDLTPTEIAQILALSRATIRTYLARIERKQGAAA